MEQAVSAKTFVGVIEAAEAIKINLRGKGKLNLFADYTKGAESGLEMNVKFSGNESGTESYPRTVATDNVLTAAVDWEMTTTGMYEIPEYTVKKGEKLALVSLYGKNTALAALVQDNLTFTSKLLAFRGNAVTIQYINADAELTPLSVAVEGDTRIQVTVENDSGDLAALVNQGLTYTAKSGYLPGAAGNDITIELVDPGEDGSLSIVANSTTKVIQVTMAYATGAVTSDADAVKAAIEGDPTANGMVTVTGSGSSPLSALAATPLAGGGDNITILSDEDAIKAAIEADEDANALVTITGTGSSAVSAVTETALTGGLPTGTVDLYVR